jgi:hypothetical protein
VTKNGDIKKCILVEGLKEGGRPVQGDVVLVKSQGKLKDGTMIDDYPTLVFRVGEYEVIEGLDLVVQVRMRDCSFPWSENITKLTTFPTLCTSIRLYNMIFPFFYRAWVEIGNISKGFYFFGAISVFGFNTY